VKGAAVKSLIDLWMVALEELGSRCSASTTQDAKSALRRFEHEGWSFWTITLPAFCKDFERSLEEGSVGSGLFCGFRRKGGLPLFLRGFLCRVFDSGSGVLLEVPDVESIYAVRQLTLMFGKMLLPCSDARNRAAINGYLECEQMVKAYDTSTPEAAKEQFFRVSQLLFADVFRKLDRDVEQGSIMGKHGPGATADKLYGNAKFDFSEWTERLEEVFPFVEHGIPNSRYWYRANRVDYLEPGSERPVKVTLVPKTLKTPRVIAIEPTAVQYMQQGVMEKLVDYLERDSFLSGMVGFSAQGPNQVLAQKGSSDSSLATLDLSEASDRVSNQHVGIMLRHFPSFLRAVDATRSRMADVPGVGVIPLAKFASMGSALTFPMEAMVFLTLIFCGIEKELNTQMTPKLVRKLRSQVRVYGDDIIVPAEYAVTVKDSLETFGFKVNAHKSFWNGKFRESCGKEYYDGVDVSVVRVRRVLPASRLDVQEIVSTVSLRNQLYLAGMWRTASHLDRDLEPLLRHYPVLDPDTSQTASEYGTYGTRSPLLGRVSFLGSQPQRVHPELHIPLVKGWVVHSKPPVSPISGEGALLKWFLKRGDQPFADRDHLERQGRPQSVSIKLRWKSPH